jgi:hypothetical protein
MAEGIVRRGIDIQMQKPRWKLESFDETLKVQIGGVGDKFTFPRSIYVGFMICQPAMHFTSIHHSPSDTLIIIPLDHRTHLQMQNKNIEKNPPYRFPAFDQIVRVNPFWFSSELYLLWLPPLANHLTTCLQM